MAAALGPAALAQSAEALGGLIRLAKARSAQSVLLQTWAYASGNASNPLFPDYPTMQVGCCPACPNVKPCCVFLHHSCVHVPSPPACHAC